MCRYIVIIYRSLKNSNGWEHVVREKDLQTEEENL